ncbi:MAG: pyridoxamine 5'-phosphate oxidase family protein [Rhodoferax sp.]|nr:pyridoxamine 5'-phosphate oxidase family protein [Rhodoferax sp.]
MKTANQTNPELRHVAELIKDMDFAMLTTTGYDNALISRPMTALEMDAQGVLWFFTDLRSSKIEHLRIANLAFTDTGHGTYVSLSGRGELDTDRQRIKRMWTPFAKPWFPDGPDSPNLALLKFIPDGAEYWDAPSSRMVRAVSELASMVTGKPVNMGEHGVHSDLSQQASNRVRP